MPKNNAAGARAIKTGAILLGLLLGTPIPAYATSLFFTPKQVAQINNELQKSPQALAVQAKHLFHLASIMYVSPNNWTVWAQGEKWTPVTQKDRVRILLVDPESITLTATLHSGKILDNVTLRPHQSLNLLTGKVVEGL